jgi:hypothetical protein
LTLSGGVVLPKAQGTNWNLFLIEKLIFKNLRAVGTLPVVAKGADVPVLVVPNDRQQHTTFCYPNSDVNRLCAFAN